MKSEKSLEEFNFKFINNFDVSQIKNFVLQFKKEWDLDTGRQTKSIHHSRTKSYHILWYPLMWVPGQEYLPSFLCESEKLFNMVEPLINKMADHYDGKPGRVTLVNLPSHKLVTPHKDRSIYSKVVNRVHIPILTNDDVYFSVDDETLNMKEGQAWEVNNAKLHGAYNLGDSDRVHLMIDIINNDLIGTDKYSGGMG